MNRQFAIYLAVGAINTCFGYFSFAALNMVFGPHSTLALFLAAITANVANITFSLLTQKTFVFKTQGNIVREWLRFASVSAVASMIGSTMLPVMVFVTRATGARNATDLAWALLLIPSAIASFLSHRKFTFAKRDHQFSP